MPNKLKDKIIKIDNSTSNYWNTVWLEKRIYRKLNALLPLEYRIQKDGENCLRVLCNHREKQWLVDFFEIAEEELDSLDVWYDYLEFKMIIEGKQ